MDRKNGKIAHQRIVTGSPGRCRIAWLTRTNYCVLGVSWQWLLPVAAALFFLLAPLATFAQKTAKAANGPGTSLKGTVTTRNGDVLMGATVKLAKNPPIGVPATAETDDNGRYEFRNLQSGNYSISVEGAGFKRRCS
jgi:Carboxypeptidase regulatory-like domain